MIVHWKDLLLTYITLFLLLSICYILGFLIFRLSGNKKNTLSELTYATFFWRSFVGFCMIVSLYAIFSTGMRTCFLSVPVLLLFFCRKADLLFTPISATTKKNQFLFTLIIITSCFWIFYTSHFFSWDAHTMYYVGEDVAYYGRTADYLNFSHAENTSLNYLNPPSYAEPYHYGDIWLTAFLEKFSGLHPILLSQSVTYPFFQILSITGIAGYICNLFPALRDKNLLLLFVTVGFLCWSTMYPWTFHKLFLVSCIIIGTIFCLHKKAYDKSIVMVCIGSLLYITIAPVLVLSLLFVLSYSLLKKRIYLKSIFLPIIIAATVAVMLFLFYSIYYTDEQGYTSYSFASYKTEKLINICKAAAKEFMRILPFLLVFFTGYWRDNKAKKKKIVIEESSLMLFILPIAGLFTWCCLYIVSYESVQFFQNIFSPFSWIIMFISIGYCLVTAQKNLKWLGFFLAGFYLFTGKGNMYHRLSVSTSDYTAATSFLKKHGEGYFVNLKADEELNSVFSRNTVYDQPLLFIDYIVSPYVNISLNSPYLPPIDKKSTFQGEDEKNREASPFYQYIKTLSSDTTKEAMIPRFIRDKSIRYLTASGKSSLPVQVYPLIKDSVTLTNQRWKIYFLQP